MHDLVPQQMNPPGLVITKRELPLSVGDRVLLRDKTAQRHMKLQGIWEREPYTIVHQPNPSIPIYEVQLEGAPGPLQIVHPNMLGPCFFVAKDSGWQKRSGS